MQKIQLLLIDPQEDFCNPNTGALYVPGADDDMKRLAAMIDRIGDKISQIQVTLDCHYEVDVAHPPFWINSKGENPAPFTIITSDDVRNGVWKPFMPSLNDRMIKYVEALEAQGNFPLCIWPPHCLIGTAGNNVYAPLAASLKKWQTNRPWNVNYVSKGSNPYTEHYGAIEAEVPDPADPMTQINTPLIQNLISADTILVAGEALSHCLKTTVEQIADKFGDDSYIKKLVLLTDATSSVAAIPNVVDFPAIGQQFITDMVARGMRVSTTTEFLAA
jgi:nicotinamidase-related amidase